MSKHVIKVCDMFWVYNFYPKSPLYHSVWKNKKKEKRLLLLFTLFLEKTTQNPT